MSASRVRLSLIGLGPMGTALARTFLRAGCELLVWNRSPERLEVLRADGAMVASSAAEAIAANPITLMCVRDDEAARAILASAPHALADKVLVQMTTMPLAQVRDQDAWVRACGGRFLMGCVSAYPDAVGRPDAAFLYAGDPEVFAVHRGLLESLGGRLLWLGADPCAVPAAYCSYGAYALGAVVLFLEGQVLARHFGISTADFRDLARLATDLVLDRIDVSARRIEEGDFYGDHASIDTTLAAMQDFVGEFRTAHISAAATEAATAQLVRMSALGKGRQDIAALAGTLWQDAQMAVR